MTRPAGLVVIKPSGYSYEEMTPDDMVVVDLDGEVVEGHLKPSIDTATHLYVYAHRPDVSRHRPHPLHLRHQLRRAGPANPGRA